MERETPILLKPVLDAILPDYSLPLNGDHGIAHWARVLENGLRIAEESGANLAVVSLFAVLHDCRRYDEFHDPFHGPRAAYLAEDLRGSVIELSESDFRLLYDACHGHTTERTHPNVTIQTCWDADRLDLGRVGITPDPSRLCTEAARSPEIRAWAHRRATHRIVPDRVRDDWGLIDL